MRRDGFTLVELLVVILIISILAGVLIMVITHIIERQRRVAVEHLIVALDKACDNYFSDFREYPPTRPYSGSQNLHYYLGRRFKYTTVGGTNPADPLIIKHKDPYMSFESHWLEGNPKNTYPDPPRYIVDAWGYRLIYKNPGIKNKGKVDIYSPGPDGESDTEDDIINLR
jgi:general secretion pathway protein G